MTIWAIFFSSVSPARVVVTQAAPSSESDIDSVGAGMAVSRPPEETGQNMRAAKNASAAITTMMRT